MDSLWIDNFLDEGSRPFIVEQFKLRQRIFVEQMGWQLNTCSLGEVDQYDTPLARYCVTTSNGKVVASARLLPMNRELGPTSYMIRDASLGRLLPDLPPDICGDFPAHLDGEAWEATRLTVSPDLSKSEKKAALAETIGRMVDEAKRSRIERMVAIGGIELFLGARSAGYPIERKTEYYSTSSGKIAIFEMPIIHF